MRPLLAIGFALPTTLAPPWPSAAPPGQLRPLPAPGDLPLAAFPRGLHPQVPAAGAGSA